MSDLLFDAFHPHLCFPSSVFRTRDEFSSMPPFFMLDISKSSFIPKSIERFSIEVIQIMLWDLI